MARNRIAVVVLAAVAVPLVAQTQFRELGKAHLPQDGAATSRLALIDVDGDGDNDVLASGSGVVRLYQRTGNAIFAPGRAAVPGALAAAADVDGDGDPDILTVGSDPAPAELWLNDGAGNFVLALGRLPGSGGTVVAVGDVDGDNDLDIAVSSFRQSTKLWLNNGAGFFVDVTALNMPSAAYSNQALVFADYDGDGDLDLFVGNVTYTIDHQFFPGPNEIYFNDGTGVFSDGSATHLPNVPPDNTLHVAVADFDGNGTLDLALGETAATLLFSNQGGGVFVNAGPLPGSDRPTGLAWVDVDGDTDLDLVASGSPNRVYRNDGGGAFTDVSTTVLPVALSDGRALATGQIDAHIDEDLLIGADRQIQVLLGERQAFVDATRRQAPPESDRPMALGDVDGDGDLDLVLGGSQGGRLQRNDGHGHFTTVPGAMPAETEDIFRPLLFADVDGDGDLDLLFIGLQNTPRSVHPRLYLNDGTGRFTDGSTAVPRTQVRVMTVGDVDNDGDPDLILGVYQGQDRLYLNDGTGTFADAPGRLPPDNDPTNALVLLDVDGDNDLDLVLGETDFGGQSLTRLYLNDGTGRFADATLARMPNGDHLVNALVAGDVDGDGDRDLVLACWGSSSYPNQRHRLYRNDGNRFVDVTAGRLPNILSSTSDAALVDVDADGDLDLMLGLYVGGDVLWLNDGTGTFTTSGTRFAFETTAGIASQYLFGDVDEDGDADLFVESRLFINLHRQIDAPLLARLGAPYTLRYHSQPGYGAAAHLAQPFLSGSTARLPLPPWGVFGLSPAGMLTLPAVTIPPVSGVATWTFVVPFDVALSGQPFFVQAMIATSANLLDVRFTNVSPERVR